MLETGRLLERAGYKISVLNTINFKKSMHYNPFSYIHSEKDILKLVTCLIANTTGQGKSGDEFWLNSEKLLYMALIGYIHYEAPEEEQNFGTMLEMLNSMEVREDDEEFKNPVDCLFDELKAKDPGHFAVRQYAKYKLAAGVVCSKRLLNQAVGKSLRTHNLKPKKGAQVMRKNEKITALYERLSRDDFGKDDDQQRESISYAVCAYFGIETGENSFGYIATWSKGKELPELKASLEIINRTASGLITDIDRNYKALMKEHGLDKEPESLAAEPVQEITVQEPEPVSAPDNACIPDPAISVESMNAYGYTDANMLPLTKERALELMERDVTVYMLHTDNTEAMAFDADEIRSFDGIFGVEASEWETVKDRFVPQDYEKAFLDNPADSFAIYQLRDNDDTARLRYMNSEYLEKKGLSVQKENYAAVYAGDLDRGGDTQDRLNELYETFNIRRPEDFRGHSLSVSDIVALKQNGVVSCHYVDSWGFKELPGFLKPENYLKNAEMAMEDDYGMIDGIINNGPRKTVAELEEQSKTGTPISLLELAQAVQREDAEKRRAQQPVRREKSGEKPSILAKLKTPSVADTKSVKSAPKRSAEREL